MTSANASKHRQKTLPGPAQNAAITAMVNLLKKTWKKTWLLQMLQNIAKKRCPVQRKMRQLLPWWISLKKHEKKHDFCKCFKTSPKNVARSSAKCGKVHAMFLWDPIISSKKRQNDVFRPQKWRFLLRHHQNHRQNLPKATPHLPQRHLKKRVAHLHRLTIGGHLHNLQKSTRGRHGSAGEAVDGQKVPSCATILNFWLSKKVAQLERKNETSKIRFFSCIPIVFKSKNDFSKKPLTFGMACTLLPWWISLKKHEKKHDFCKCFKTSPKNVARSSAKCGKVHAMFLWDPIISSKKRQNDVFRPQKWRFLLRHHQNHRQNLPKATPHLPQRHLKKRVAHLHRLTIGGHLHNLQKSTRGRHGSAGEAVDGQKVPSCATILNFWLSKKVAQLERKNETSKIRFFSCIPIVFKSKNDFSKKPLTFGMACTLLPWWISLKKHEKKHDFCKCFKTSPKNVARSSAKCGNYCHGESP